MWIKKVRTFSIVERLYKNLKKLGVDVTESDVSTSDYYILRANCLHIYLFTDLDYYVYYKRTDNLLPRHIEKIRHVLSKSNVKFEENSKGIIVLR